MTGRTTGRRAWGLLLAAGVGLFPATAPADLAVTTDTARTTGTLRPGDPGVLTVGSPLGATLTLSGPATRADVIRVLIVGTDHGYAGPGGYDEYDTRGRLVLSDGASLTYGNYSGPALGQYGRAQPEQPYTNTAYIGFQTYARGDVTVTGSGSTFTNTNGTLYVGYFGSGTMNVLAGGYARSYATYVGGAVTATGPSGVTVSGANSVWQNTSDIYAGNSSRGTVTITDGGRVNTGDAYFGLKYYTGDVNVSGAGSTLNVTNELGLGFASGYVEAALSQPGTLTIGNGALVNAGRITVGWSTANRINLGDGGTLRTGAINGASTGVLNWTGGTIELLGTGRIDGGVTVPAGGTLVGSGLLNSTTVVGPGGLLLPGESTAPLRSISLVSQGTIAFDIGAPNGFRPVTADNAFTAGGTLRVGLTNGYVPAWGDVFDLMNFNRLIDNGYAFDFTNAVLPAGLAWDTSAFATTGAISVVPEPAMLSAVAAGLLVTRRRRKSV